MGDTSVTKTATGGMTHYVFEKDVVTPKPPAQEKVTDGMTHYVFNKDVIKASNAPTNSSSVVKLLAKPEAAAGKDAKKSDAETKAELKEMDQQLDEIKASLENTIRP